MELLEESVAALRGAGPLTLVCYYTGTAPFVLALLYFWADMSAGAYAERHLPGAALGIAAAFIWMKCWQSVFAGRLLAAAGAQETTPWTAGRIWRLVVQQTAVQSTGLFVMPVATLITLPAAWVYAFYQNFLLDGSGEAAELSTLCGRSVEQAKRWPGQNHIALAYLSLFALVVLVNVLTFLFMVPSLAKTLLGIETLFSRSGFSVFNTTVFATAVGLTHLIVDPICKALYVLRCFYGRSIHSGDDLKVNIRRLSQTAAVAAVWLLLAGGLMAEGCHPSGMNTYSMLNRWCRFAQPPAAVASIPSGFPETGQTPGLATARIPVPATPPAAGVESERLERSIENVLDRPEYAWRSPRVEEKTRAEKPGLLGRFGMAVGDVLGSWWKTVKGWGREFMEWLKKYIYAQQRSHPDSSPAAIAESLLWLLYGLGAVVIGFITLIAIRAWRNRRKVPVVAAEAVKAAPDLRSDEVTADELPEDRWLALAEEMAGRGEFRLSLRALYLAALANLGCRELIVITRAKSNKEFRRELDRRASITEFERGWYGRDEVTRETVSQYTATVQRIREC